MMPPLSDLIKLDGCSPDDRLVIMKQNPMDSHRWSKPVSEYIRASELRDFLAAHDAFALAVEIMGAHTKADTSERLAMPREDQ